VMMAGTHQTAAAAGTAAGSGVKESTRAESVLRRLPLMIGIHIRLGRRRRFALFPYTR